MTLLGQHAGLAKPWGRCICPGIDWLVENGEEGAPRAPRPPWRLHLPSAAYRLPSTTVSGRSCHSQASLSASSFPPVRVLCCECVLWGRCNWYQEHVPRQGGGPCPGNIYPTSISIDFSSQPHQPAQQVSWPNHMSCLHWVVGNQHGWSCIRDRTWSIPVPAPPCIVPAVPPSHGYLTKPCP